MKISEKTWEAIYNFTDNLFWLTFGMNVVDNSYFKYWTLAWLSQGVWLFLRKMIVVDET